MPKIIINKNEPIEWATNTKGMHNRDIIAKCDKLTWLNNISDITTKLESLNYKFVLVPVYKKARIEEIDIYTNAPKDITGIGSPFINYYHMK